jgi:hypothetical protein
MSVQNPGSPNRDNFGSPLRKSLEKEPFGCKCGEELQENPGEGREAIAPLIIKKVQIVQRRKEMPPNDGIVLPENVHV